MRPAGRPWLPAAVLALVAGLGVFSLFDLPSAAPRPEPEENREPLPEAFSGWPPLVAVWEASDQDRRFFVRLAWEAEDSWSLAFSPDVVFEESEIVQVVHGGVDYRLRGGSLVRLEPGSQAPPFDACDRSLQAARRGRVTHEREDVPPRVYRGPVLAFGDGVRCMEPYGVPLTFSLAGHEWRTLALGFRPPFPEELGAGLLEELGVGWTGRVRLKSDS